MIVRLVPTIAVVLGLAAPGTALAHHSTEVFFDRARTVEFVGTLVKVDLINPHSWFRFEEAVPNGPVKVWNIEADHPSLIRRGSIEQFGGVVEFETGKTYTVRVEPSWTSPVEGYLKSLVLPDGSVFTCC